MRIGHGYDVHRFGPGDALVLGGVRIPHDRGLVAHSDGDVLIHAVCDALLGALGQGDIGQHFPDTDPANAGIDSRLLLRRVMQLVQQAGWVLGNLDATIIAQAPRMAPHIAEYAREPGRRYGRHRGAGERESHHHGKAGLYRP